MVPVGANSNESAQSAPAAMVAVHAGVPVVSVNGPVGVDVETLVIETLPAFST